MKELYIQYCFKEETLRQRKRKQRLLEDLQQAKQNTIDVEKLSGCYGLLLHVKPGLKLWSLPT